MTLRFEPQFHFLPRLFLPVFFAWIAVIGAAPVQAAERRTPIVAAVEKSGPAVVNIRTERIVKRRSSPFFGFSDPFFDQFFKELAPPRYYKTQSLGSGVVIDAEGHLITNSHVIAKASKVFVALPDSPQELEAELVGEDPQLDVAVLKIKAEGRSFPFLPPGRADDLLLGETVIAIGNPLGLGHSITTGIVSAPRRRIPLEDGFVATFIQTDALINPGNSGGPLININGELIGINTAIVQQAQGIGFSISIEVIKRILDDLLTYGRVRRAYLGAIVTSAGEAFASSYGPGGVLVASVDDGSPAAAAGLQYGDVIIALDSVPVTSPVDFVSLLASYTPQDRLEVELLQGFTTRKVMARLADMPKGYGLAYAAKVFGFTVTEGRGGLGVSKVTSGSPAEKAGIRPGDRVAQVAGAAVQRPEDFARVVESEIGREPVRFLIVRGNQGYNVELP